MHLSYRVFLSAVGHSVVGLGLENLVGGFDYGISLAAMNDMALPPQHIVTRALELAEKRIGMDELARHLKSSSATIGEWRTGRAAMPQRKYVSLVDLLAEIEPEWLAPRARPRLD